MLNVERVRLLTAALRSGEYEQGNGMLHGDGRFCCLGVATEVAMANGCPVTRVTGLRVAAYRDDGRPGAGVTEVILLPSVVAWYGFGSENPVFEGEDSPLFGGVVSATVANDDLKWSFARIADAFDALADAAESEQQGEGSNADAR